MISSVTLCSVCVECVCGEKSSTGGIRQLFLQQLRQRWGRGQERVCNQSDSHHRDCDHGGWQGDHPAHRGRQKREGSLQQVHMLSVKWCAAALSWLAQCIPYVPFLFILSSVYIEPFFPLSPPNFCPHNFTSTSSVFLLIFPSPCLFPPFLSHLDPRVFRPAVRRYVVLEVLCSGVWNVFMKLYEGF